MNKKINRRSFIKVGTSACVLLSSPPVSSTLKAASDKKSSKKIVWILLRGGLDSLHTIVPTFDRDLAKHRASLLEPIQKTVKPLDRGFGLHPALKTLHSWYQHKELIPIVAVASPYRSRSHFDAQDMLESGLSETDHNSGWLARALQQTQSEGLAIARTVPISLRGGKAALAARTWYPSSLPDAEADLYERLAQLYSNDPALKATLAKGLKTREMVGASTEESRRPKFAQLAKGAGQLLASSSNVNAAMLDMGGWDTHNGQANRLERQLANLDEGLLELKKSLGDQWQNTVVIVATEFGRTVKVNGTRGTDHGTASAMFLAGGAVRGGQVLGDWPGLGKDDLYQGRDLKPTSDIRGWLAAILGQHWGLSSAQLNSVFPEVEVMPGSIVKV